MSIYVGIVNPLVHWLRIPFGTGFRIPLIGLFSFQGIGFQFPLRGLSGFGVTPGLVVPEHPLPVTLFWSFEFYMYFVVGLKYLGIIVIWGNIGWCFVT